MKSGHRRKIKRFALQDADAGVSQVSNRIVQLIGLRPTWDTEKYADQGFLSDDLQEEPQVRELRDVELTRAAESKPRIPGIVLLLGVAFFILVAALAAISLLRDMGWPARESLLLGVGLECLLVMLTAEVHSAYKDGFTGRRGIALAIYVMFLVGAAGVRLSDLVVPGGDLGFADWASAILLVFATAGPAVLAETCLRAFSESAPTRRVRGLMAARLRQSDRRVRGARRAVQNVGSRQRQWDEDAAQLRAIYEATFHEHASSLDIRDVRIPVVSNGNPNARGTNDDSFIQGLHGHVSQDHASVERSRTRRGEGATDPR